MASEDYRGCPLHEDGQLLKRDEVEHIVRTTVKETLVTMGVDVEDPIEMQRDFQALRDWRRAANAVRSKGLMTVVGILTAGIAAAVWVGVRHALKS